MESRKRPIEPDIIKVDVKPHFQLKDDNYFYCKHCEKRYKYDPTGSTTTRSLHLKNKHPELLQKKETVEVAAKKARTNFFPQVTGDEQVNRRIVRFFCQFNIPYTAVDSDTFEELMKSSGKNVKLPCRKKLSNVIIPQYATEIRSSNAAATSGKDVSLSFDEYSKGTRRFLGIACNYIDDVWILRCRRLAVESFPKTTTGEEIATAVKTNVENAMIKSVVGTTRDGGSNVVKACKILGNGDIHCYDHVLNLGLVCGHKFSSALVLFDKAKALSTSFARSPTSTLYLKECGAIYSMKTVSFTRWNYMGRVVCCILLNWDALEKYALHHSQGKKSTQRKLILDIDEDDLAALKEFKKVFQFFEEQFKMAESRTALASSILYMAYQLKEMVKNASSNEVVNDFLKAFLKNFEPRVETYRENDIIKISTFLDPRFCMKTQLYSLAEWEDIKKLIIEKFDISPPQINDPEILDDKEHKNDDKPFGWVDFDDEPVVPKSSNLKDELEIYVNKAKEKRLPAPLPNRNTTNMALEFWKQIEEKCPILAPVARKYLSILATSAEPERCFSTVTDLFMNSHRNGLRDEAIEDIVTIKNELILEKAENARKKEETIVEQIFVEIDDDEEEEFELIIAEEEASKLIDDD